MLSQNNLKTFSCGLISLVFALSPTFTTTAEAISAEEQRKRDLFMKIRAQQQQQAQKQPQRTVPKSQPRPQPKPAQRQTRPQSRPAPKPQYRPQPQQRQTRPPQRQTRPQPQPSRVVRKPATSTRRAPQPAPRPTYKPPTQPQRQSYRPSAPAPTSKGPGIGSRLKNLASATREKLESLPRTNQSLGRPQEHALPSDRSLRNVYESNEPSYRSKVGPAMAELKPSSKPKKPTYKPTPKPSYTAPSKPKTTAIAKAASKPKPKPKTTSKPKAKSSSSSLLAAAASKLAKEAGINEKVTKKIITEATPPADMVAKTLKEKTEVSTDDLKKMKLPPRTLIASLEKYIPLDAEQLIGEGNSINLDEADLEPITTQVKSVAKSMVAKTQKVIPKEALDPADMPAIDPADMPAIDPADAVALENGSKSDDSEEAKPPVSRLNGQIQPMGMSFFERFALSTIVASENHLATIPKTKKASETNQVSTAGEEVIKEPVVIEDPEAVKFQSNDIPASSVSPGLDEMVISSTSQTDFDLNDSEMAFIGNVQVKSPRFNLRADKFVVHLKKDNSGMAYGEAIGNVVIEMRENGRPTGYSGLASNAVYHPVDGKIVLSGWPKIRQQFKEHVAITRDTKMVLYTDGRVKTLGRNRTVIRK